MAVEQDDGQFMTAGKDGAVANPDADVEKEFAPHILKEQTRLPLDELQAQRNGTWVSCVGHVSLGRLSRCKSGGTTHLRRYLPGS